MSTHAVAPSPAIDESHPALNTPQPTDPTADAYAPSTLQHGLTRDADGRVIVKPDLAEELDPKTKARANRLLDADRRSEANSLIGCGHIQTVTSFCGTHEAEHAPVVCGKPLLHEACAAPKARVRKFAYDHAELHDYLRQRSIQVLTFTIPKQVDPSPSSLRVDTVYGRAKFGLFIRRLRGLHGWQWLAGFSRDLDGTTFHVIHEGDRLPHWPELNALWRRLAGNSATLRIRTFDGKDGDTQADGLWLANSGFVAYWDAVAKGLADPLEMSLAFKDEDLTALYGEFRGFAGVIEKPKQEMPTCTVCGKQHVPGHGQVLLTNKELAERFDHIRPTSYGQRRRRVYRNHADCATSPP